MCRAQLVLALLALSVGLVHPLSWEIVEVVENRLQFYSNGTLTHETENFGISIDKLTYDAVHNRLLFIDKETTKFFFLYSFNLETMELHPLARINMNKTDQVIQSLAYDPVSELVFWMQSNAIFSFSLKPGFNSNVFGNLLIEFHSDDNTFSYRSAIAVDSCKGFIYWNTLKHNMEYNYMQTTIERARLNGSDQKVILDEITGQIDLLVIDQQTRKMYLSVETDYYNVGDGLNELPRDFSIESVDLDEKEKGKDFLFAEYGDGYNNFGFPEMLTVSNHSIYWVNGSGCWKLPKTVHGNSNVKPEKMLYCKNNIAINYKIEDQTRGVKECEALISKISMTSESFTCNKYCIQGNCSINDDGQPQCRCNAGYSGQRCEVDVCQGYCLNNGDCSLNEENVPVCQCRADYEGARCEVPACLNKHFQTVAMLRDVLNMDASDATHTSQDKGVTSTCAAPIF